MATNYLVLGQVNPASATATTLYTVPSATQAVVSTIAVCNQASASSDKIRIAVRPDGAAASAQHYIIYDAGLQPNQTIAFTLGITLGDTDVLTVYAAETNEVSFAAFGSEIS